DRQHRFAGNKEGGAERRSRITHLFRHGKERVPRLASRNGSSSLPSKAGVDKPGADGVLLPSARSRRDHNERSTPASNSPNSANAFFATNGSTCERYTPPTPVMGSIQK